MNPLINNKEEKSNSSSRNQYFHEVSYSHRDVYYRKAKEEGFRARSVYKLKEIHYNFNILSTGSNTSNYVDLCAAPGSWSQMLRILTKNNLKSKIVSVDIQDIVPIEGVNIVKGDITSQETIEKILSYFNNEKVDVIIFDGAPDVTGLLEVDMYMQVELIIFALVICIKLLKNGGKFCAKLFKISDLKKTNFREEIVKSDFYYDKVKLLFDNVFYFKPSASRASSHETFIVCEGYGIMDEELVIKFDKLKINDLFDFENNVTNQKIKDFLNFLIKGAYSL